MQYLCLIYEDEKAWEKLPPAESAKIIGEFHEYTESMKKSGHYAGGKSDWVEGGLPLEGRRGGS